MVPRQIGWTQDIAGTTAKCSRRCPKSRTGEPFILASPRNLEVIPHRQQVNDISSAISNRGGQSGEAPVCLLPACKRMPEGTHAR